MVVRCWLQNAKLYTGTKDTATRERSDTDIIVHKGTITAIGTDLEVPSGATVIDAAGRVVTPGIVDMYACACCAWCTQSPNSRILTTTALRHYRHSHCGVYGWPEVWAREDGNEMTNPAFPMARAIDAWDPQDDAIPLILGGGVTTSQVLPGSGNVMGGEGFIIKMRGNTVRDAYVPGSPRLLKMACGENPKRVYG